MTPKPPAEPSPFDCRRGRHKVITTDRICVICGAQGVTDARRLPPLPEHEPAPAAPAPLGILDPPRSPHDLDEA